MCSESADCAKSVGGFENSTQAKGRNNRRQDGVSKDFANKTDKPSSSLMRPVFFIGFMGAGKSSVARRLARKVGLASVDMDTYIERRVGKSISEIFEESGEDAFREIETEFLRELATSAEPMLISCGGGVVVRDQNRKIIADCGYAIYLEVDADEAASRISDKSTRPLFNDIESARARLQDRIPLYTATANATVSTSGKNVYEIAMETKELLEREGLLCQQQK